MRGHSGEIRTNADAIVDSHRGQRHDDAHAGQRRPVGVRPQGACGDDRGDRERGEDRPGARG
jgi:hypothetical protein